MAGWLSVILVILALLSVLTFYLHKHNLLPIWLSDFLSPKSAHLAEELKSRTEQEEQKSKELQAILEAKQKLMQVKKRNTALRHGIAEINEDNVNLVTKKYLIEEHRSG